MNTEQKTILVVEDEASYRHSLAEKLNIEGFNVLTAENGEMGLSISLAKHPDMILLDLQMPKMDGIEMVKKLRADQWGKNAKVIILTNMTDMKKTQQALENQVFQYLIKTDVKLKDLIQQIKDLFK